MTFRLSVSVLLIFFELMPAPDGIAQETAGDLDKMRSKSGIEKIGVGTLPVWCEQELLT